LNCANDHITAAYSNPLHLQPDHVSGKIGIGLLFHMTQPTSRSIIKAIACSKPTIGEH